jgi:hypothetical protein
MDILDTIQDIVDHAPDANTAIEWVRDYLKRKPIAWSAASMHGA